MKTVTAESGSGDVLWNAQVYDCTTKRGSSLKLATLNEDKTDCGATQLAAMMIRISLCVDGVHKQHPGTLCDGGHCVHLPHRDRTHILGYDAHTRTHTHTRTRTHAHTRTLHTHEGMKTTETCRFV